MMIAIFLRSHRKHAVYRCGLLLQMLHVAWSVCLCVLDTRVTFKIAVLVFQCLTGQAPAYLADDCQLTSDVSTRRLRSTDTETCVVRRSK